MCEAIDSNDSASDLQRYVQQKQAIGQAIRALQWFLDQRGSKARCDACHELMVKLAEDRFTLAVVGQFKRGKSSLMNAIVGRELLPAGVLPLTSVVTILRFGPQERILIPCEGFPHEREFPISSLREYVTEKGNPGNRQQIKAVYVEVRSPFLRRGLEFVDTPGIGSAIAANTETTYGFLPKCDAVLFVTSMDSPFADTEISFLRDLRQYVRKVFLVVNKSDLLDEAGRTEVLEFVRTVQRREMATSEVRMFPISARDGLAAKLSGNQQQLVTAGIPELEEALGKFLADERAATFLAAILDQAMRLLQRETDAPSSTLRTRFEALSSAIRSGQVPEMLADFPSDTGEMIDLPPSDENAPGMEDLSTRGCPACESAKQALFDFFSQFQYRLENESGTQKLFAEELGFCPLHTWHLCTLSSVVGISAGYAPLARRLSAELLALTLKDGGSSAAISRLLTTQDKCRACRVVRDAEKQYLQRMAPLLQQARYRESYAKSEGLCLRHLAMLLELTPDEETKRFLLKETARRFQRMSEDMLSYVIKRDARRRALLNQDEEDAYVRALTHLVGSRYLSNPNPPDAELSFPVSGPDSS